jgi:hypothetical protein
MRLAVKSLLAKSTCGLGPISFLFIFLIGCFGFRAGRFSMGDLDVLGGVGGDFWVEGDFQLLLVVT